MIFKNLKQAQFSFRLIGVFMFLISCVTLNAYDFEKDGLYYNILSESTVECCGGGQSPSDATYRKTEISIPSTVRYNSQKYTVIKIADQAWCNVKYHVWIKNLTLPETIEEIGYCSFRDCNNLERINLPSKLTTIGDGAFQGSCITSWIFPQSLKKIGRLVFNSRLKNAVFTSACPPLIDDETFMYQNGGQNDLFIPSELKIYVPNKVVYKDLVQYDEHIVPLVNFDTTSFEYSGIKPIVEYTNNCSEHNITLNLDNLPINAGLYQVNIDGVIDQTYPFEIPLQLSINKAPLSIYIDNFSREYGTDNPKLTAKCIGLKNNETIEDALNGNWTFVTACDKYSDIGVYPIELRSPETIISNNYNVEIKYGQLTVTKAPLKIYVQSYQREYGLHNPIFEVKYDGLRNDEPEPKWLNTPNITTQASIVSDTGNYPIHFECEPLNYNVMSCENGVLTITKAPLELKANNYSREYFEENPDFNFTLNGLRNGDSESCLINQPTMICSANKLSGVGEYEIVPSNVETKNYELSYQNGTLTIIKAPLILAAINLNREYGDSNPILRYEAIGFKGNDDASTAILTNPLLSTTALESSNVGEYPITIIGGSSKNYDFSYRNGILTITKAPLSVMAENSERMYGDANPKFVCSYLGFKLSDTESSAFSVLPTISTSASKTSDVGEYPIIVSGGTARNYEIVSYENGILSVTRANATISANNKKRLYFEENPQFDFFITGLRNGDTNSCVTTLPAFNCEADILSDVGVYEIMPSDAAAKNYVFEYVPGNLYINKRQLTAYVGNYSRVYGENNPKFEVTYSGFVNNEDASVLVQPSIISCEASPMSDVGSYPIEISGGEAKNYHISKYNYGTLTISKANQNIIWDQDLSKIDLYSQVELQATSDANLPVTYEMSPNNVATIYNNAGKWYLDCYGRGAVNIRAIQNGDKNHNAAATMTKTLVVFGGGDDPSNPQIYLNVEVPGTLPTLIAENRKYQIKNLRLTGYLNGTDINYIREMCGSDSYGNPTVGVLETLDISGCTIVSGGRSYYLSNRTSENVVGNFMFYNCKVLATLRIPDNATSIGDYAFADCERLSVISISNSVKSFGEQSFINNISLIRLSLPDGLETIGDMAFSGCSGLTEITIPSSVTYIGSGITKDCHNLVRIIVEADNAQYASRDGVLYNSALNELIAFPIKHSESVYIVPNGVVKIFPYAFENAKGLNMVGLPASLLSIGQDAFIGCINLTNLQVQAVNPPTCQNDCFDNISKTRCELQVPIGCRSYYWVAPVWSEFNKIVETDFSGISNVNYDDVQVEIVNGKIIIDGGPINMIIRIYQINGTLIYQEQTHDNRVCFEPSSNGIYLVVIGNKTYKLKI